LTNLIREALNASFKNIGNKIGNRIDTEAARKTVYTSQVELSTFAYATSSLFEVAPSLCVDPVCDLDY
jgi:hypothetical protein